MKYDSAAQRTFGESKSQSHVPEVPRHALAALMYLQSLDSRQTDIVAVSSHNDAASILKKNLGEDHPRYAMALNNLSDFYREQRAYPQAEPMLKQALAIREALHGPNHAILVDILESYAKLLRDTDRQSEANAIETRVKSIQSHVAGRSSANIQR